MSKPSERSQALITGLEKIASHMAQLEKDNAGLRTQVSHAQQQLAEKDVHIEELQSELKRLKLAKAVVTATGDKAEMKHRVSEMVKEIDKCIALLNR